MKINRILVTGRLMNELHQELAGQLDKEFLFLEEGEMTQAHLEWADAFVSFRPPRIGSLHNVKWVHALGAGVDSFVFHWTGNAQTVLTRTVGRFGDQISEYCLSYILRDLQNQDFFAEKQRVRTWAPMAPRGLKEQQVVIFGVGSIGGRVGEVLQIFGATVQGVSRGKSAAPQFDQIFTIQEVLGDRQVRRVIADASWIICTLPLTKETNGLLNEDILSLFNGASLINVGRGQVIDEQAMVGVLERGHIKQCILDVFKTEPLPVASPLWTHPQVTVTPHISALTHPRAAAQCFLQTLRDIEAQRPLPNQVDIRRGY